MLKHHYGPRVHILNSVYLNSILTDLCHPETFQPQINHSVQILYSQLLARVIDAEFKKEQFTSPTRMTEHHPDQFLAGERIATKQKIVCVNLARAGTYPSHICYELLHEIIHRDYLRQDHVFAARKVNEKSEVVGTDFSAQKIGGDIEDAIVIIPDPMGATGGTASGLIEYYRNQVKGNASKFIALNLVVTPEYLKKVSQLGDDVIVYSLRVDRGLSSPEILNTKPGTEWDLEKGLNEKQYIVPGAGGFGEIMNNSFV